MIKITCRFGTDPVVVISDWLSGSGDVSEDSDESQEASVVVRESGGRWSPGEKMSGSSPFSVSIGLLGLVDNSLSATKGGTDGSVRLSPSCC